MQNEIKEIQSNAEIVKQNKTSNVPMLFFISNGEGTGWDKDKWINSQIEYIESISMGKYIKLDSGHYVHDIKYEKIAEESIKFIEDL